MKRTMNIQQGTRKDVHIDNIDRGVRAREDFGDLSELANSIKEHGLLNPVTLFDKEAADDWDEHPLKEEEEHEDRRFLLMAGDRRYKAWTQAEIDEHIPANVYEEALSKQQIKAVELIENIHRKDLTYKEEVKLTKQIHDLQQEIKGEVEGTGSAKTGHSMRDTARMLNRSAGSVSEDLQLAEAMDAVPELFENAKNKTDAKKVYKKAMKEIEDEQKAQEIREKRGKTDKEKLQQKISNKYILKDVMEGLGGLDSQTIGLMEVDPPLQIGFEDVYDPDSSYEASLDEDNYRENMHELLSECYRVMKKHSWIIVWYPIEPFHQIVWDLLDEVGFKVRSIPLIWDKKRGNSRAANYNLANHYEVAMYARKGDTILNKPGHRNIFEHKLPSKGKRFHKTEKPIELYEELFEVFSRKGSQICTAYAGSGNGILAAENIDRTCFGFDISEDYKNKFDLKVHQNTPPNYTSYE